jgi:predicted  nucleic acid-binding Zn-ribbon protein
MLGLAAFLAGCDNEAQNAADSEMKTLRARVASVGRENDNLKASIDTLKAENTSMARKMQALTTENRQLKRDLEIARAATPPAPAAPAQATAAAADSGLSAAPPATIAAQGKAVPAPAATPTAESPTAALERSIAELETRITELQPKIIEVRSRISEVARSTVDQAVSVPAGAIVQSGTIFKKEPLLVAPYYRLVPLGPAVRKGDFRSQAEKDDALRQARDAAAPVERELKALQTELTATKVKLLKLKSPAYGAAQPADPPAAAQPAP